MAKPGRKPRPEPATPQTAYLSRTDYEAINNIRGRVLQIAGVNLTSTNDVICTSLRGMSKLIDTPDGKIIVSGFFSRPT